MTCPIDAAPQLRVESSALHVMFAAMLPGVRLPLSLDPHNPGVLLDADKCEVLTVDVDRKRSDADALAIAGGIMVAVNTCGGFRAEDTDDAE